MNEYNLKVILNLLNNNEYWVGKKEIKDALHIEKKLCNYDLAQAILDSVAIKNGEIVFNENKRTEEAL